MNKRGQVWVETVIYTLIGFSVIGLVLAFAKPKIEEIQDKLIIEQSIEVMRKIDSTILEVTQGGIGNQRVIEVKVGKGNIEIDGLGDKIIFEIESRSIYSEPEKNIQEGNIIIHTDPIGKFNIVTLTLDYSDAQGAVYDINYDNEDIARKITKSAGPYEIIISNKDTGIDIKLN